ncbi:Ig-like domain repeat protein [Cellulomonas sp. URHD0024]|uniref:Ig-like domain repeat protein n=1 Tax=Cellulomonas sp. URHD0024 TaxID=1302620 RepID=UPI0003FC7395|nr:Ig-like domain repeat protein [Cellulomonas sp. URHD0024]
MGIRKTIAAVVAGTLVAAAAVALAGPASAVDESPDLPGDVLWFNTAGPLASQTPATQIFSGSDATNRPWITLTTENPCPAGTTSMAQYIRVPGAAGVPEIEWTQVQMGGNATLKDADGRFYTTATSQADRLNKSEVIAYQVAHPGTNHYPFLSVCQNGPAVVGNFRTMVDISGNSLTTLAWTIHSKVIAGGTGPVAVATTTTLAATPSGVDLVLTATVAPAAAAGTVTFKEGATVLGSAPVSGGTASHTVTAPATGNHTYTASFTPTDPAAYVASTVTQSVALGLAGGSLTVTLTVPGAPAEPGALTLSVPSAPVALAGVRDAGNTRITASGALPQIVVTDTRRDDLLTGWRVSVQAGDFTGTKGTVGAKYLGWKPATPVMAKDGAAPLLVQAGVEAASFLDDPVSTGLGASKTLAETTASGRGATTLGAALNLAIPPSTAEGSYTSTITVTLVGN